jgi:hypothetical protein
MKTGPELIFEEEAEKQRVEEFWVYDWDEELTVEEAKAYVKALEEKKRLLASLPEEFVLK